MQQRQHLNSLAPRAAFSLIEVLMVIGIMSLLVTILVMAIGPILENAKINATKATIAKLDRLLQQRLNSFQSIDFKNQARAVQFTYNNNGNSSLPSTISYEIAEILVKKDRYRAAFPQCPFDLYGFDGTSGTSDDAPLCPVWSSYTNKISAADSSELLYLTLTQGQSLGGETYSIDDINVRHIADTDGDGLLEFVDDWGNPLRFYNAPTRLLRADTSATPPGLLVATGSGARLLMTSIPGMNNTSSAASPIFQDPLDILSRLTATSPAYYQLQLNQFLINGNTAGPIDPAHFYDSNTYFAFLIVSSGPDGSLGLGEPHISETTGRLGYYDPANSSTVDALTDNITNRQQ